jgi:CRISPR-associated protein Cmr2
MFSLGPVQEFIASARRSRDLWYGSTLLSESAKTAARTISEQYGLDALIFPKPLDAAALAEGSALGVANKIVAVVPGDSQAAVDLAGVVEAAVRAQLEKMAAHVFDGIGDANLDDRQAAERQIKDLPEIYWVTRPLADDFADYGEVRRYLEALLAARKTTRDFVQLAGRPNRQKSSLDGVRESVIPRDRYPSRDDLPEAWSDKAQALYDLYGAGPAEQLSGIDLLKRKGSQDRHFPSTSHFAALPYLQRVGAANVSERLPSLLKALASHKIRPDRVSPQLPGALLLGNGAAYDASILYAARLTEDLKDEGEKRTVAKLLDSFLQELGGAARPGPYYALLHADGDHMGSTIDGLRTPQAHAAISAALNRFAGQVEGIVAEHGGAAVYSGGDDVLAFLPLHKALACAVILANLFAAELAAFAAEGEAPPSLSAGIAITHHIEPLADALRLARAAEHAAKQVQGKNALAIVLSKRSGGDRVLAAPRKMLAERLQQLVALQRQQAFSDGAAYQMEDMLVRLARPGSETESGALRFEAKRILEHKPSLRRQNGSAEGARELLFRLVRDETLPLDELVNELIVAKFLAGAEALAAGK